MTAEQPAEHRNLAKKRQLAGVAPVLVVDQAGQQLVLAVLEAQHAGRRARADAVGHRAGLGGDLVNDVADLERDLERHFVVEIDRRFDVEFEADIEVGHRFGREAGGGDRRGDVRHAFADQDLGLFAVARPDARVGQQVDVAVGLIGADDRRSDGDAGGRRGEVAELFQGQSFDRQRPQGEVVRPVDPQRLQPRALDLEDLDFHHDFGFGDVLQGDQFVGQADRFRAVADHQQVEFFVDHDVARLEEGLDGAADGLGVGIGQVVGLDHQCLVFLLFGRGVRVDEERVAVEHALIELVGEQEDVDHRFDGAVAQEEGGSLVGAHVLVEYEIESGGARDDFEYGLQRGVAEFEADRFAEGGGEYRFPACPGGVFFDDGLQGEGCLVSGVGREEGAQAGPRAFDVLFLPGGLGFLVQGFVPLHRLDRPPSGQGPFIARLQGEDAAVGGVGFVVAQFGQRPVAARQVGIDFAFLRPRVADAVLDRGGVERHGFLDLGQPGVDLVLGEQRLPVAIRRLGGAADEHDADGDAQTAPPPAGTTGRAGQAGLPLYHYGAPPIDRVCDCLSGR